MKTQTTKTQTFSITNKYQYFFYLLIIVPFVSFSQTITATRLSDNTSTTYVCDGVDDHVQINQALDFVKDNGGTVTLSAGTFIIDDNILFKGNNTSLEGAGMDQTTIKLVDDAGWDYYYQNANSEWVMHRGGAMIENTADANRFLSIKNLKIDGNKYNQSIYNPITGETIQDTPDSHVFDGQGHYVAVDFSKRQGAPESISDILFSHVFIYENAGDGLVVDNGTNIMVEYCKGIRGGHSIVYLLDPINLVVKNCDFMVTSNSGIRWYDGNHIQIKDNHIYGEPEKTGNSNFCIQVTSGQSATITDDLIISGNHLEFSAGAGIALDAKQSASAKDVIIKNNVILQCGNSSTTENMREAGGINIKNFTHTLIENNTIVNCIGGGIRLGGNVGFNTEWSYETGLTATITNNIITNTIQGGNSSASGYGIDIGNGNNAVCTFNNVWNNQQGDYNGCIADAGSLSVDPKFKQVTLGTNFTNTNDVNADLHLKSDVGRWNSNISAWETDTESSLCINGGNPNSDYSNEPLVNGNRINLGAYGNTNYASQGLKAPPVANAGPDQYIRDDDGDGIVYVTLDGSNSTDDGSIQNYSWMRNGIEILNAATGSAPFVLGAVEVTLIVTDDDGYTSSDKVNIKILPTGANINPIANAGNDITTTDLDDNNIETISFDGSQSYDVDAIITNYSWSENGVEFATGVSPTYDFSVGTHIVTLTVTDNEGGTNTDTIQVEVRPKRNYALEFNNDNNDEVIITNNLTYTNTFTIEFWMKQTAPNTDDTALLWLGGDGKRIVLKNGHPSWDETTSNTSSSSLSLNTWHHLAFVVNNNVLTNIYVDGTDTTITDLSTSVLTPTAFNFATFYGTADPIESNFIGRMDEVRYWNTARTGQEINDNKDIELTGNEIGLVAYWNFNDGSGNRLSDKAGIADGTLYNMEENDWVTDTPFSPASGLGQFSANMPFEVYPNPVNDYVNIHFNFDNTENVCLDIYDVYGKQIRNLIDNEFMQGEKKFQVNLSKLSKGIYIYVLKTNSNIYTKKLIVN